MPDISKTEHHVQESQAGFSSAEPDYPPILCSLLKRSAIHMSSPMRSILASNLPVLLLPFSRASRQTTNPVHGHEVIFLDLCLHLGKMDHLQEVLLRIPSSRSICLLQCLPGNSFGATAIHFHLVSGQSSFFLCQLVTRKESTVRTQR